LTATPVTMIESPASLGDVRRELEACSHFCVDTESNSLFAYRETVCYIQMEVRGRIFILDTLAIHDLDPLIPFFEDESVTTILHGADYDVSCLGRDYGLHIGGLFDTMVAAQLLGYQQLGLAARVEHLCDAVLDKSMTRHDWGKRPLDQKHLGYLSDDVLHLDRVWRILEDELKEEGIREEASIEFRRVSRQPWGRTEPDPEAFRRIKGAGTLQRSSLSVLKELHALREAIAEDLDRPPFKVLGNHMLMAVAQRRPRKLEGLSRLPGFTPNVMRRFGRDVIEAVIRGCQGCNDVPLRNPNRKPPMSAEQAAIVDGLKSWRKKKMESDERSSVLILPNQVIERLALERPGSMDELAANEDLGQNRLRRYGQEILEVLRKPPDPLARRQKRRRRPDHS